MIFFLSDRDWNLIIKSIKEPKCNEKLKLALKNFKNFK